MRDISLSFDTSRFSCESTQKSRFYFSGENANARAADIIIAAGEEI